MTDHCIGVLGSHSAEEVGINPKTNGFDTVIVYQKGRDGLYTEYNSFLYTHKIVLNSFNDLLKPFNPFHPNGSQYSYYYFEEPMSTGRRIAREIKEAVQNNTIAKVVS